MQVSKSYVNHTAVSQKLLGFSNIFVKLCVNQFSLYCLCMYGHTYVYTNCMYCMYCMYIRTYMYNVHRYNGGRNHNDLRITHKVCQNHQYHKSVDTARKDTHISHLTTYVHTYLLVLKWWSEHKSSPTYPSYAYMHM